MRAALLCLLIWSSCAAEESGLYLYTMKDGREIRGILKADKGIIFIPTTNGAIIAKLDPRLIKSVEPVSLELLNQDVAFQRQAQDDAARHSAETAAREAADKPARDAAQVEAEKRRAEAEQQARQLAAKVAADGAKERAENQRRLLETALVSRLLQPPVQVNVTPQAPSGHYAIVSNGIDGLGRQHPVYDWVPDGVQQGSGAGHYGIVSDGVDGLGRHHPVYNWIPDGR